MRTMTGHQRALTALLLYFSVVPEFGRAGQRRLPPSTQPGSVLVNQQQLARAAVAAHPPTSRRTTGPHWQHDARTPSNGRSVRLPELPSSEARPYTAPGAFLQPPPNAAQKLPTEDSVPMPEARREGVPAPAPILDVETVLRSVEQDYPLLAAALQERGIASGELLSAEGPFNTMFTSTGRTFPLGFYRYTIANMFLEKANWSGGRSFAGYKLGRGPTLPIWFGDLETNDGGEFRAGFTQSMLQGLAIDKRRADYAKAQIAREAAEPVIQGQRIEFLQAAAIAYWKWLGAGRRYVIAQQILTTAQEREKILTERVRRGDAAPIERTDNRRIVVDREAKLIAAARVFQQAAIELSLFYRAASGLPQIPDPQQLPHAFRRPRPPRPAMLQQDVQIAFQFRPELRELALKRESFNVNLRLARNQTLPKLDAFMTASKDVGAEDPPIDKTPFQLEAGVVGGIPLQRSDARGRIRAAQSSVAQVNARMRWARDKITAEVQDATSALVASYDQIRPTSQAVQYTYELEVAERRRYEVGDSNLFVLNLRELQTADAAALEVDAIVAYFIAKAVHDAALGLDGLRVMELLGQN